MSDYDRIYDTNFSELPLFRSSDPDTSLEAVPSETQLKGQSAMAFEAVRLWPGRTCGELARLYALRVGMNEHEVHSIFHRRLAGVRHRKLIKNGQPRPCAVKGKNALTWEVV